MISPCLSHPFSLNAPVVQILPSGRRQLLPADRQDQGTELTHLYRPQARCRDESVREGEDIHCALHHPAALKALNCEEERQQ